MLNVIKNLIKRGLQVKTVNDKGHQQEVQLKYLGQTKTAKVVSPYGLFGASPLDSEFLIFTSRANKDDLHAIGNDYKNRIKDLKEGEVMLLNTKTKTYIILKSDKSIEIKSENKVDVDSPQANFTGDVNITGELFVQGIAFTTHTHGGVMTGGSNTAPPNP